MLKLHESIVADLIEAIVSGRHAPGTSLSNEIELAQARGVSRTAAREAMQKLQSLGLIEVRRRKGASVLPRSAWNLLDPTVLDVAVTYVADVEFFQALIEARLLIEPRAAELAAQRANDQDIERIEAALTSMGAQAEGTRGPGWHDADLSFHTSIIDATGNWVLRQLIVTIRAALAAEIRVTGQYAASPKESLQLHRNVFEAIRRRQPAEAHAAMTWLLLSTRRDLDAMGRGGVLRSQA
ncbi:FadR/GntR family transcriptional regulator [Paraburkholderia sediminicola]|uniref:FadR/GntR family transcriptional regulator n=1 Tax=Paraburkholderia sediminicola TaxID=458836 RepID=UPI0038BB2F86